jgi:hypothetical protein
MTLVGKFFLANDDEHEAYRTGEVIAQITPSHYLMQFDNMAGGDILFGSEVVGATELAASCKHCGGKNWTFYDNREKLQAYLDWLNTPEPTKSKLKVVPLKKK